MNTPQPAASPDDNTASEPPSVGEKFTILFLWVFIIGLMGLSFFSWNHQATTNRGGLQVGEKAPAIVAGKWIDNIDPTVNDGLKGKVVVVDAWGSWCVPCRKAAPELIKVYEQYKDRDDIVFLGLTIQPERELLQMQQFLASTEIPWANGYEARDVLMKLQADTIPKVWVIDKTGIIAWNLDSSESMEHAINNALKR